MLDENLPAFFLKPSPDGIKHHRSFYLSHHGSDPEPAYALQHADPASPSASHKNCYAAALFDAYNREVLYGEVLARPLWNQPTLSQEEIRRNGGVPPPPLPVLPHEFYIQLYNPDQQIKCEMKEGKWGSSDSYEFSMPETSFRTPSASNLDKGQDDPSSLAITPKINFVWRKESRLSKDFTCYMTGKSTDTEKKKSKKDPDIAIALWRSLREMTIYESNLGRVDIEDPKGLEVVLLLSAVVVKDLFFSSKDRMGELFNITDGAGPHKLIHGGRKLSNPPQNHPSIAPPSTLAAPAVQPPTPNDIKRNSLPRLQTTPPTSTSSPPRPPPLADPRAQWELDAETARLRAQAQAEARASERKRIEREKADEAERRRLQRMVEEEERQARRKQADIDRETERLRKKYGVTPGAPPPQIPARAPRQRQDRPYMQTIPQHSLAPPTMHPRPNSSGRVGSNGLYINSAASSSAVVMSGANPGTGPAAGLKPQKKKSSFFGLRSSSDDGGAEQKKKLAKKSSAMW
ncbi:hypothetical protein Q7P37_000802 [Cladosporium fusiforme]